MKRCPECRRDYYDDTLLYCLDDGSALVEGPATVDEPATAILHEAAPPNEAATRAQIHMTDQTAVLPTGTGDIVPKPRGFDKRLIVALLLAILIAVGGFVGYRYLGPFGSTQVSSIAVMPFVNDSGNADVEYLSDGMTETLIRNLSQLPDLNVKARSSVFRYKGKEADARTVGKELSVQAVLNGRVVQRGDQLILNLELVDAQTENVIWTDQYDRKASDLVTLQNEIARDVSSKLKIKLSGVDQQKLLQSYTKDAEAYRLYLQGRFYWNKRTGKEFERAEGYFRQAVERDPSFALGYVGLADFNEDQDRQKKKEYIRRALELDDQLAEAHASLGYQLMMDFDWAGSEGELARALELNPNYAHAHQWNGNRLTMIGRHDQALASYRRALELEPSSTGVNFHYAFGLYYASKADESIEQLKKLIAMDAAFPWAHNQLSRIYRDNGNKPASVEERAVALDLDGFPERAKLLRESYARDGWNGYMREGVRQRLAAVQVASFLAELGEKEKAIDLLVEYAGRDDHFWLFVIKSDPFMNGLHDDPRFLELVKKFDPPQ